MTDLRAEHLHSPFGTDRFGRAAERFARFFGTPKFILGQTAYAAPPTLLAQTRQADRDKARQANTELTERIADLTSGIHAVTCEPPASPIAGAAGGKATP